MTLFRRILLTALLLAISRVGLAQTATQQTATRLDVGVLSSHSHTSAATITITPPAGQYVYVTGLDVTNCAGASAVSAAAPTFITTTNLGSTAGVPQYMLGSGTTAGACQPVPVPALAAPIKSAASGTNVTFVLPTFATNQTVSLNVYYYFAQ